MSLSTAERLKSHSDRIVKIWSEKAKQEVTAKIPQQPLAIWGALPDYLGHLEDALSKIIDRTEARRLFDFNEATRIGKNHGDERAGNRNYTIAQVITEYHVLRQVICDVLEEDAPLTPAEREIIVCSLEQAVNDAASQFSDTLWDIQEQFTHTLAHDLRNPISAAKTSAQMILRKPEDVDRCIKSANRIALSMDRLDSMIHDLLDANRIKAGQGIPLQFSECDLEVIAKEVVEELNFNHENRFVLSSNGLCKGIWSETGLRRILENLATNAAKYGDPHTQITISISQTADRALLTVHNYGKVISAIDQKILFKPFARSRSAESQAGWGLGLTVVKGITEAHHGKVTVSSEVGQGTSFKIDLPKKSDPGVL
jgi:signal transduction histidine kinase